MQLEACDMTAAAASGLGLHYAAAFGDNTEFAFQNMTRHRGRQGRNAQVEPPLAGITFIKSSRFRKSKLKSQTLNDVRNFTRREQTYTQINVEFDLRPNSVISGLDLVVLASFCAVLGPVRTQGSRRRLSTTEMRA